MEQSTRRKKGSKWTYEQAKFTLSQYENLSEFKKKERSCLNFIRRNKYFDLVPPPVKNGMGLGYWTEGEILKRVKKYDYLKDFRENESNCYNAVKNKKWNHLLDSLKRHSKPDNYWDRQKAVKIISKYKYLKDFAKEEKACYSTVVAKGWIDLLDTLERVKKCNGFYTYEKCKELASKYKSISDFRKKDNSAYSYICKKNWHELLDRLKKVKFPNGYWNKERVVDVISRCNTLSELRKNHSSCYNAIKNNNWHYLTEGLKRKQKPSGYWNRTLIKKIISKYTKLETFREQESDCYNSILKNNWHDLISGLERGRVPNNYYTYDVCQKVALRFKTRVDFKTAEYACYGAAQRNGFLDDICQHMKSVGNLYKRCVYMIVHRNDVYIGLTYDFDKRVHRRKDVKELKEKGSYIKLTSYLSAKSAAEIEKFLIKCYTESDNWNCLNKRKGGSLGSPRKKKAA